MALYRCCLGVCVSVYICVGLCVLACVSLHRCVCAYVSAFLSVHIYIYSLFVYLSIYVCISLDVGVRIFVWVCMCVALSLRYALIIVFLLYFRFFSKRGTERERAERERERDYISWLLLYTLVFHSICFEKRCVRDLLSRCVCACEFVLDREEEGGISFFFFPCPHLGSLAFIPHSTRTEQICIALFVIYNIGNNR